MPDYIDHHYKIGDDGPYVDDTLLQPDGQALDLEGYRVTIRLVKASSGRVIFDDREAVIRDAAAGEIRYVPQEGDMTEEGLYFLEWVTDPLVLTIPTREHVRILAHRPLGG